jgi:serine/threonine protein kinase
MALAPGSSIGSYQILASIGRGGMGEVYRARDAKLKREVAIKSLPEAFARDTERLARFQREAEALAALNHPNIGAIYGLEESGGTRFLVLELVEGETLEERLRRGALAVEEALRVGAEIAGALEAAHEKGVIHRDLKPANIMITPDGQVKVLDFGLASAVADHASSSDFSNSPTLSMAATRDGVVLGTAAYMSPEQAKGRKADKRADIFSFGCVLYEMLTGRPAFEGEDVPDILSRVLQREPDWSHLPSNLPRRVRELLERCLEKDVKKRRRDMGDVRIDIERALHEPDDISAAQPLRGSRFAWTLVAVAGLMIVALSVPAIRHLGETPPDAAELRLEITTPATSSPLHFAISPDGRRLAFVASGDGQPRLWVRPLNTGTSQPLAGTEGAEYPFWSPDSRSIGFFAGGKLKGIDISGGPPQAVADAPAGRGGAWNRDGTILFAPTNAGALSRVSAAGGEPVSVTRTAPGGSSHRFPQFLPDGRRFLFFVQGSLNTQGIYLGSLDGGEPRRLVASDTAGAWAPPGRMLFVRLGALVARPFDAEKGEFTGEPVTVADPVGYDNAFNIGGFSVSAAGLVTYRALGAERRQLVWFDRNGKAVGTVGEPDENFLQYPELSPDGRRVGVTRIVQGNTDVWLIDLVRGGATRFTFDEANDGWPLWSPDGTQIAFRSNRKGAYDLYLKPSSGASHEEPLQESTKQKGPLQWSSDGRFLLFWETDPKTGFDLWTMPMTGDRKPLPWVNAPFTESGGQFSPDGRWVAYQSDETGRAEIYVQPFPAAGAKWQVSTNGGTMPRWRPDGKELFFIAPDSKLMAATVTISGTTFQAASPVALFQTRIAGGFGNILKHNYAVSGDGRFLINVPTEASSPSPVTLILNWKP